MPIVIKYGGNAMTSPELRREVAGAIGKLAAAGEAPIVVHGGGPFIAEALERAQVKSHFVRGLRVTTAESLPIIESVLTSLSKALAQEVGNAIGLTGRDAKLLVAKVLNEELGYVGEVQTVNKGMLEGILSLKLTPVIACLAENEAGDGILNVNADTVAGAVAGAMRSPVVFLSDTPGVLEDPKDASSLLTQLSEGEIGERIADGRIAGGMIPKVEAALDALKHGAAFAVIADGRKPDELAAVLRGERGTRVVP